MNAPVATQIPCQQCAAPLAVEQGSLYVTCAFCGTTNFVDKARAVFHYALRTTVRETDASAALRRWMAGNQTVKDLDKKATIESPQFELFPMWLVRAKKGQDEKLLLEPAAALSISELKQVSIPAADLEPYDHALDDAAVEPTVPYEAMRKWLADDYKIADNEVKEVSLVHMPLYIFKYSFGGRRYTAVVDAATSKVFASIYPSKMEMPYLAIAIMAFAIYFCAALAPLIGLLSAEGEGLAVGVVVYIVLAVVFAVPIFVAAAVISSRV